MPLSPAVWGASLVCALGGAFAGTALGSSPLISPYTESGTAAPATDTAYASETEVRPNLPDHYPLVTRSGTVGVEQLADRGLYSQARYRPDLSSPWDDSAVAMANDPGPGPEPSVFSEPESKPATRAAAAAVTAQTAEPAPALALAEPVTVAASGNAKTINVNATLALR